MTKQNNQCQQTVLLATIISIFLFGAFGSTFAQAKNSNLSAFYNLSSNANPNSLFNPTKEFDLTKIQPSNLFAANFKSADDYPKPDFSDNLSSNANPNSLFNPTKEFDLTKIQPSNLFAANFKSSYYLTNEVGIEKWYEIVKYEYGDIAANDTSLYYWVKPKTATLPTSFHVDYFDKDGVASTPWSAGCAFYAGSNVGQVST